MEFGDTEIGAHKGMEIGPAVHAFMIVTMVGKSVGFYVDVFAVRQDGATLTASDGLYKVKREGAGMSDGPQEFPLVFGADTLAGVFQQQEVVFAADLADCIQVGHGAAHMNGHDAFGAGGDRLADGFG